MFKLSQLGWKSFYADQYISEEEVLSYPARIAKIYRSHCVVWSVNGINEFEVGGEAFRDEIAAAFEEEFAEEEE